MLGQFDDFGSGFGWGPDDGTAEAGVDQRFLRRGDDGVHRVFDKVEEPERLTRTEPRHELHVGNGKGARFLGGVGDDRIDGEESARFGLLLGRLELGPIRLQRLLGPLPGEVVREYVAQTLRGC